ncbi:MAG: peptidylprolyl isomerase [Lactobacillaceae bacterium]|jgi:peptidylprolyl isomerase|nr:peptidylprolyl isomerase [Lactobacillaceae bacterium]
MTKEIKKADEPKKLAAKKTTSIPKSETKQIGVSEARAKKIKHSYKVKDPENSLVLKLKDGDVVIEMFADAAPNHVARIKELVRSKFYDGLKFHRVIEGFMAQTGCPLGTGTGGSGQKIPAEFSNLPHKRGTVSMARAMHPHSADSQFFICFNNCEWLDGQYTIWGEVTSGMEYVDMITKGKGPNGQVQYPDEIITIRVVADL